MLKAVRCGAVVAILALSVPAILFGEPTIVYSSDPAWIHKHAAEELVAYIGRMTGEKPKVLTDKNVVSERKIVVLGNSSVNRMAKQLEDRKVLNYSQLLPSDNEGFIIRTLSDEGRDYLLLAGTEDIGTLYAVYTYLERFCGVGFFRDGDFIPKMSAIPFSNIECIEKPRFKWRAPAFAGGYRSFAKFEVTFWDLDEWKRQLDWMVKRKLNTGGINVFWTDEFAGVAPELAWPELGKAGEGEMLNLLTGANSVGWIWPLQYRTKLTKDVLAYGRSLGIKFIYWSNYDCVPGKFKDLHPEFKYFPPDAYGNLYVSMDDPEAREYLKKYLQTVIDLYGTDHLYMYGAYAEAPMGGTPEESVRIKTEATHKFNLFFKEVDPEAIWTCGSWDFNATYWNKESIKQYLTSMSKEIPILVIETDAEMPVPGKYEKNDYFYGINWCFGVINSFGGDDGLHGNIDNIIDRVKNVCREPRAKNCVGLFMSAEMVNDNVLLWHLVSRLAWDPEEVDRAKFLQQYALQRYGERSAATMLKSLFKLVEAVYTIPAGNYDDIEKEVPARYYTPNNPYYQFQYMGFGCRQSFPLLKEREGFIPIELRHLGKTLPPLKEAIRIALLEKGNQMQNRLYENDLVDMARTYLGLLSNYQLIALYQAFKEGNAKTFEEGAKEVEKTLDAIEKILSTREDFSLEVMMRKVKEVPGTNRHAQEVIKHMCVWLDYVNRDCFEAMHYYYRPKLQAYISASRGYLEAGRREITLEDLQPAFEKTSGQWKESPINVEENFRYKGSTVEAIEESIRTAEGYKLKARRPEEEPSPKGEGAPVPFMFKP